MNLSVAGKRIVITGASSGLGLHFARLFAREGASLGLIARREDRLSVLAEDLDAEVYFEPLDLTAADTIEPAFMRLTEALDGIDILVNNAGVTSQAPALEQTLDDWDSVLDTNLRGCWLAAKAAAVRMQSGGSIVNIASILGLRGANQVAPYAISKAGLVQMTKVLALEWARLGIRVNALAPGYIETDLNRDFFRGDSGQKLVARIPQRRLGQPSDLDAALLLLASDAGAFITGSVLPVDGGHIVNSL